MNRTVTNPTARRAMIPAFLLASFFLLANVCTAQRWIEIADTATNFYTIRDSFYKEWDGKPYEKGKGFKQFKRWEWFMEPRVFPSGEMHNPAAAWEAIEAFNANKNSKNYGSKSNPGASWTPLGPSDWDDGAGWNAGNGRINVVVQDPVNSNTVYVGAASGGLWKSTNGGTTWTNLTDDQPVLGVSGIAIDPDDTDIIYIGTGDGDASDTYSVGVLKSTDGGNTWSTTGLNWSILNGRVIRKLQMHPDNPDTLFAATSNGLYKTMDAGATWTNVLSVSAQDVEIHPTNPSIVYTCTDQFYRSTDGGNTFTLVTTGLPTAANINRFKIAVSADEPDWVYVVGGKQSNHTFEGIYRSTDAGVSFTVGTNTPNMFGYDTNGNDNSGQSWYDMAIAVNPANADEVYIAGVNVWKSTNGGTSFTIITQWTFPNAIGYVHADVHDLAFFGSRIYSGSDGGVYKSENLGDDWTNLTVGITIMQFYDISGTPQNANLLMGGAQDNGTNRYNGTPDWTHMIGADGMNCQIDPTNQSILYGAIQYGQIYKSTNGGASISVIVNADDFGESGNWVAPYALDPADHNTIFVGYEDVHKSIDGGANWTSLTSTGTTTTIYNLEIAPSNSDYIYITKSNSIFRTTNGGTSWTNITGSLPSLFITDIAIDPENTDRVWVSLSGYTAGSKIFKTENGGTTWTNISSNLPNLPANCIAYQPNTNDILYVGMDVGIYTKNGAQTDWTSCSTDLPNVIINEIEINTGVNKIQVGSYGRGAWVMDLPIPEYCLPVFNNPCTSGFLTDGVVFQDIDNQGTGCEFPGVNNYADYTGFNTSLDASTTYPIMLTAGQDTGVYFAAMIDFNQDADFGDAGEFFAIGYANPGATISGNIVVPASVAIGTTLMRILCKDGTDPLTQAMVCDTFDYGEVEDYSIDFLVPECVDLTDPVHGATNVPVTTALSWQVATGSPTGYRLDVGTTSGGVDILNNFNVGNVTTYNPPGDFPAATTIYVTVKPYNGNGAPTNCEEQNFTTVAVPIPTSCLPEYDNECTSDDFIDDVTFNTISNLGTGCGNPGTNNYTNYSSIHTNLNRGQSYSITLAPGADWGQYFVVLIDFDQNDSFLPDEFFDIGYASPGGSVSGTIAVPSGAALGTALMRVICQYDNIEIGFNEICGTLPWGEVEDYSIDILPPNCTSLTDPTNGATNVPIASALTWAAATNNPSGYRLDVGTTSGGTDILNNFDAGNVTTYDPPGLFPYSTTIYVTITPYNANGDASDCSEESFTTLPLPLPPNCTSLTSPVNGATNVAVTSALTWAAATGSPTGYRLDVGTASGGTDILNNFDAGNVTTYDPPGDFPFATQIFVKITPYNANGDAVGCSEESFTTQIPPPACTNLTSPANGATNVAVTSALTWAAATGSPTGYRLNVGTTSGGTDILNNFDAGNVTTYDPPGDFPYNSTIYVKITPYNATGDAAGCSEESFSTQICIPNLTIANMTIPTGTYRSTGDLTANNDTIASSSVVVFKSDTGILLQQDFTVDLGGELDAVIEACPTNFTVVIPSEK